MLPAPLFELVVLAARGLGRGLAAGLFADFLTALPPPTETLALQALARTSRDMMSTAVSFFMVVER